MKVKANLIFHIEKNHFLSLLPWIINLIGWNFAIILKN